MIAQSRRAIRLARSVSIYLCMSMLPLLGGCVSKRELAHRSQLELASSVDPRTDPQPRVAPLEVHSHARRVTVLARPSEPIAARVGHTSRYRVVFEGSSEIVLVLLDEAGQARARMRVSALDRDAAVSGWAVEFEEPSTEVRGRVELWSVAGRLHGQAQIGERDVSWRVRLELDGTMAAERWSRSALSDDSTSEVEALRRARALGVDLVALTDQIATALEPLDRCHAGETVDAADLALDLALRAFEGRGRAELPVWTPAVVAGC